jgi:hypothetical protein
MAFADLAAELTGMLPGLSPFLAETFINRAWRAIRDARTWGFLVEEGVAICPAQITTSTVAITQYSQTVVCSVAATNAILASLPTPLALTSCQIRFGGSQVGGFVYNILTAVLGGGVYTLTLDRVVEEATAPLSSYQIYRCYITPPTDFLRWISLDDMVNGYSIIGQRLDWTKADFDQRDPQRQAQGQAYYCGHSKASATGAPLYELWPHPVQGQVFSVTFRRRGVDFTAPTDAPPPVIPDELIVQRALGWMAYPWAMANVGHFPALKGANFVQLIQEAKTAYRDQLLTVKKQDDEQSLQRVYDRGHSLRGGRTSLGGAPADANFWQAHPIFWTLLPFAVMVVGGGLVG